ncbi:hypothetical protein [Streptomyces sp. RPT161]|uniref:hypothetical protein n=1 Tax=Streptomyces sp. RPT161 TaxID=3015993 RepID=UPI0022B8F43C|nr:hypothetical protein [Streptomyces sp. RPT161]
MVYLKLGTQRLGAGLAEVQMLLEPPNADWTPGAGAVFGVQPQRAGEHIAVYAQFSTGVG